MSSYWADGCRTTKTIAEFPAEHGEAIKQTGAEFDPIRAIGGIGTWGMLLGTAPGSDRMFQVCPHADRVARKQR